MKKFFKLRILQLLSDIGRLDEERHSEKLSYIQREGIFAHFSRGFRSQYMGKFTMM